MYTYPFSPKLSSHPGCNCSKLLNGHPKPPPLLLRPSYYKFLYWSADTQGTQFRSMIHKQKSSRQMLVVGMILFPLPFLLMDVMAWATAAFFAFYEGKGQANHTIGALPLSPAEPKPTQCQISQVRKVIFFLFKPLKMYLFPTPKCNYIRLFNLIMGRWWWSSRRNGRIGFF